MTDVCRWNSRVVARVVRLVGLSVQASGDRVMKIRTENEYEPTHICPRTGCVSVRSLLSEKTPEGWTYDSHRIAELPSALRVISTASSNTTGRRLRLVPPMMLMMTKSATSLLGLTGEGRFSAIQGRRQRRIRKRTFPDEREPACGHDRHSSFD